MAEGHYGIKIKENTYSKNDIDAVYPQVEIRNNKKKEIKINNLIRTKLLDFLTEEISYDKTGKTFVNYIIKLNKRGLLSILFEICSYQDDKKKGFSSIKSINLDVRKAALLNLEDLFTENSYYQYILNKIITEKIVSGHALLLQEFSNFNIIDYYYLTKDSLMIYIPLYKDTNYAYCYCTPEFAIPLEDLKGIFGSKSPALRLLKNR